MSNKILNIVKNLENDDYVNNDIDVLLLILKTIHLNEIQLKNIFKLIPIDMIKIDELKFVGNITNDILINNDFWINDYDSIFTYCKYDPIILDILKEKSFYSYIIILKKLGLNWKEYI